MALIHSCFVYFFPSWLEFWAFLASLIGVWLMTRQVLIAWPVGLVSVLLYGYFFYHGGLYADSGLQVFFAAMLLYGWWHWRHPQPGRAELPVTRVSLRLWGLYAALAALGTLGIGLLLKHATDSRVPFWDAHTTSLSLVAQWMQARKQLENWLVWILADVLYIGLYLYKDWKATAILYGLFCVLAVMGWVQWQRSLRSDASPKAANV